MSSKNKRETKGWSPERRARQAALIRAWKPWTRSTGPKTPAGKARMKENALRHGIYAREGRELLAALRAQRRFVLAVGRITNRWQAPLRHREPPKAARRSMDWIASPAARARNDSQIC